MKAKILFPKARPLMIMSIIWTATSLTACYSSSFRPVPDYPVLRHDHDNEIRIQAGPPRDRPWQILGRLYVYEDAMDISDPGFRSWLRDRARSLGADGLWLETQRTRTIPGLRANTLDYRGDTSQSEMLQQSDHQYTFVLYVWHSNRGDQPEHQDRD
ncbi:MAG: hypothetical protein KDK39_01025 [Leptospiraceae bacterium]|nr:hypothetical protein [Leptospiraceae bacterium]